MNTKNDRFGEVIYDRIAHSVRFFWQPKMASYVNATGLELPYSRKELNRTFGWMINDWELELANEDWGYLYSSQGELGVLLKLGEIANRIWESAEWYVEKDFGFAEEPADMAFGGRPQNAAEEMAKRLLEPFERNKDEMFGAMEGIRKGMREAEFTKSKAAARRLNQDIHLWVKIEIHRAGF